MNSVFIIKRGALPAPYCSPLNGPDRPGRKRTAPLNKLKQYIDPETVIRVRLVINHKDQLIPICSQYFIHVDHNISIHLKHPKRSMKLPNGSLLIND
jgi:hypothetical protein